VGESGTKWHYQVPFLGQDIPLLKNTDGTYMYRKAKPLDCMMYPVRRLMVATRNIKLSDGTSPWWHGKVPLVKFTVDDWPDQFLGYSLVRDGRSLQNAMTKLLRSMNDWSNKFVRPDV